MGSIQSFNELKAGDLVYYRSNRINEFCEYFPRNTNGVILDHYTELVRLYDRMPLIYIASSRNHVVVCHIFYSLIHNMSIVCRTENIARCVQR